MSPIQQMFLGIGAASEKTYVDDVFSTFLYKGNKPSIQSINNGIQLGNAGVGSVIQSPNSGSNALVISDSDDFQFYNGDFTFEFFAKFNDYGDDPDTVYIQRDNSQDPYVECTFTSGGTIIFLVGGITGDSNKQLEGSFSSYAHDKNWHHVAATRSGNTWRLFADGTQIDTLTSSNTSMGNNSTDPKLFGGGGSSETFRGALNSFRIVKGTALYTSNFTPPTEELTAITNTVLLLGVGSTPAVDASGQNHSISTTGTIYSFSGGGPFTSSDAGLGGLVWIKSRTNTYNHILQDSVNGTGKWLQPNTNGGTTNTSQYITSFNANGFSLGTDNDINNSTQDFSSWTFRKSPGFFTVKEYSGTGSPQSVSHDLGSQPGMILIKRTDTSADWVVYHRSMDVMAAEGGTSSSTERGYLKLNTTAAIAYTSRLGDRTSSPTATTFDVKNQSDVNASGGTYIAYIFAGGESTAATARSVDFDGSGDYLSLADSSDFEIDGTNFTLECWFKADDLSGGQAIAGQWQSGGGTQRNFDFYLSGSTLYFENCRGSTNYSISTTVSVGQWYHIAGVLDGTTLKLFVNGNLVGTTTVSGSANNSTANFGIGGYATGTAEEFNGKISNVRFVKGTAVYTSSFKPSTEPLTNITNTKLLCCNNSSTTGSTVTPGTITANGNPTASSDSPFDDPAGFVFGESGSENVIKCGSYVGTGSAGIEVNIGFEPQLILVRSTNSGENWEIYDSTRGIVHGGADRRLRVNTTAAEDDNPGFFSLQPNGFIVDGTSGSVNTDGVTFVFLALRRPDGYVGKPPELGTDVFGLGTRSGSSSNALSNVNVFTDFSIIKRYNNGSEYWAANARFMGKNTLKPSATDAENTGALPTSGAIWDHMLGHLVAASNGATNTGSDIIDYGWKRHAGFDVVAYDGNSSSNRVLSHSLNAVPQMIWYKRRNTPTDFWGVGVNFTSSAYDLLLLNSTQAANNLAYTTRFVSQPTATSFEINQDSNINGTGGVYIAFLFASVSGISKVGSYTGNGIDTTTGNQTITFGFAPRFVIIKSTAANTGWVVLDTLRGWTDSDSRSIRLDRNNAQSGSDSEYGYATSTGMVLTGSGGGHTNADPYEYIYYAHA